MKVDENREDNFKINYQEEVTYYMRNTEGARSRRDKWNQKSYIRSNSHPGLYRTASGNNYVRDSSSFRRDFSRRRSQSGGRFDGAGNRNTSQGRFDGVGNRNTNHKSQERKDDLAVKVSELEKTVSKLVKLYEDNMVKTEFVEE